MILHGLANAYVAVRIHKGAEARHLRDMAASLTEAAQQMESRGTPSDGEAFLTAMARAAECQTPVTAADVSRLRRMADWADAAPAPGWNGTLDRGETARAINAARERMRHA